MDLPASRSPRARRRYKVTSSSHAARSHYAEEEEEEQEDTSAADSEARYVKGKYHSRTPLTKMNKKIRNPVLLRIDSSWLMRPGIILSNSQVEVA